ncbi:MAG: exosortase/archaeosortase family protein [bacterium]|nr:exosortase/archaeosortase family protein [bacterium]
MRALVALGLLALLGLDLLTDAPVTAAYEHADQTESFLYDVSGGARIFGLAAAALLVWQGRAALVRLGDVSAGERARWAIPLLLAALFVRGWAAHTSSVPLQFPALAFALLGGAACLTGRLGVRGMAPAACLLVVAMPLPTAIVNAVMHGLQGVTAESVSVLLGWIGEPHLLAGEQIHARAHIFYVIEGCAGLRAQQILLSSTLLYCGLLFRSRTQLAVLLMATPFVAFAVNQLRILTIVLSPQADLSADHDAQGIAMLVLGIVCIALVDAGVQRVEEARDSSSGTSTRVAREQAASTASLGPPVLVSITAAAALYAALGAFVPAWEAPEAETPRLRDFPKRLEDWRAARALGFDREFFGSVQPSSRLHRRYRDGDREFEVLILEDDHRASGQGILSPKTITARPGYDIRSLGQTVLSATGRTVDRYELTGIRDAFQTLHWRVGARSLAEEVGRSAFALDQSVLHRAERTFSVRVAVKVGAEVLGPERAAQRVVEVAEGVERAMVQQGLVRSDRP